MPGRGEFIFSTRDEITNPDETSTPGSLQVDAHYARMGIKSVWDKPRILRLCGWLRVTPHELASLLLVAHRDMDGWLGKGRIPGPVCLLLSLLENHVARGFVHDPVPQEGPIVPFEKLTDGKPQNT